jgi:hypothetical protein
MSELKQYLGDGVYADFDDYHIVLTTENGEAIVQKIYLEPQVLEMLDEYRAWLRSKANEAKANEQ